VVANGSAALRWLDRPVRNLLEARASLQRIVRDGHRAAEVLGSVRSLFQVANPERTPFFVNVIIREVLELAGAELRSERVLVLTDLATDLPRMVASKGQLQEVILNLVRNAVDAMRPITDRARVLKVSSTFVSGQGVLIAIADSGTGIDPKNVEGLFDAFFTTKPHGTAWACDLPLDSRGPRRTAIGSAERAPRRCLSVHAAGRGRVVAASGRVAF
jgi:C4-dicarboxylate-specific signal transduction histidine kinase